VAEDIGKGGFQVTVQTDLRERDIWPVGFTSEVLRGDSTAFHHLTSIASEEHLADEVVLGILWQFGLGKVPGRVEGLGQGEMLFGNDPS
jgi:hypothetical protein